MATAFGQIAWRLIDKDGVKVSKLEYIEFADTSTIAALIAAANAYGVLLDPVTDMAYTGVSSLSINFAQTGFKTTPNAGNPAMYGGLATFSQTGIDTTYSDLVPGFAAAQVSGGKPIVGGSSPYQAYIDAFVTPPGIITQISNDRRTLPGALRVKINDRKHRREQSAVSLESA